MRAAPRQAGQFARWLQRENPRALLAAGVAIALSYPAMYVVYPLRDYTRWQWASIVTLSTWVLVWALHSAFTAWAFGRLDGQHLADAVRRDELVRGKPQPERGFYSTASFTVQIAALALFAVLTLLVVGELRRVPELLALAALLVAVTWVDVMLTYAVHYARMDHRERQIVFPDADAERAFSDYVYLASAVQTTFGVTDMVAASRRMRRTMTGHALLSFVFNTVIIAMVVSLALTFAS